MIPTMKPIILLVEDHSDTRQAVIRWLHSKNYSAYSATDIHSCLSLAQDHAFDVLICDLQLPDGTGWDLMRQLSEDHRFVGIATSGRCSEADVARSRECGFLEHVAKPYTVRDLSAALERAAAALD